MQSATSLSNSSTLISIYSIANKSSSTYEYISVEVLEIVELVLDDSIYAKVTNIISQIRENLTKFLNQLFLLSVVL